MTNFLGIIPYLIGASALLIGFGALVFPEPSSKGFGIPEKSEGGLAYVRATGARDIFIGFVFLEVASRSAELIPLLSLVTAGVSLVDFVLTFKKGIKKNALVHFSASVFLIIYGLAGLWL